MASTKGRRKVTQTDPQTREVSAPRRKVEAVDKPTILYDAKCEICKGLAHKLRFGSRKPIDIVALSDPRAHRILRRFYPDGWAHDFYVVEGNSCRKGIKALPRLSKELGPKRVGTAMAEYAYFKISRRRCEAKHRADEHGNGTGTSRREFLKYAALSPAALALAQAPKLKEPFGNKPPDEFRAYIAEVRPNGRGGYSVDARRCLECVRETVARPGPRSSGTVQEFNEDILLERTLPSGGSLTIQRKSFRSERQENGRLLQEGMTVHGAVIDHPRYNVGFNVGTGPVQTGEGSREVTSLAVNIGHDLPLPMVDFIVYEDADGGDASEYLGAYIAGVRELRKLHAREGRDRLADVYKDIEDGLRVLRREFDDEVPGRFFPNKNQVLIAPMPEMLKYAKLPEQARLQSTSAEVQASSSGCSCSCDACCCCGCGCGCGCGFCGCSCGCGCCCDCGFGCSCCCGTCV